MNEVMKKIFNIAIAAVAGAALAISCDLNTLPTFDDANAFVEFNNSEMTVSEVKGEIAIPITYSSLKGLTGSLSIEVVELAPAEYDATATYGAGDYCLYNNLQYKCAEAIETAEAWTAAHWELVDFTYARSGENFVYDGTGVITFSAEEPTQYVTVKILDPGVIYDVDENDEEYRVEGIYTGDLKFKVNIKDDGGLTLGVNTVCTVTIQDTDHPLTAILGDYTAASTLGAASSSWTMGLYKDADDDHKVWIDNIFANSGWADEETRYYGSVNKELTEMTVPFGQNSEYVYSNGNPVTLYGMTADGYCYDTGSVTATIDVADVVTIDFGEEWGFYAYIEDAGYIGYAYPEVIAVK